MARNNNRELTQAWRADGKNVFIELMMTGLPYDKILLNFKSYDLSKPVGQRTTGEVGIYMGIYEAEVLSKDILSGRIAKMGKQAKDKAEKAGKRYPEAVFESLGGTPAKSTPNNTPISRMFDISPGAAQPWVLCAKQGKGHETQQGLIVMDGVPETTIRVPMTDAKLKEFAIAVDAVFNTWVQTRLVPAARPIMETVLQQRQENIDKLKAASAAKNQT